MNRLKKMNPIALFALWAIVSTILITILISCFDLTGVHVFLPITAIHLYMNLRAIMSIDSQNSGFYFMITFWVISIMNSMEILTNLLFAIFFIFPFLSPVLASTLMPLASLDILGKLYQPTCIAIGAISIGLCIYRVYVNKNSQIATSK